ncbi:XkdQ/YqbQ family protein [Paenibacillus sp. YIM B09110]|uniref:XkdQ/YqbQ family protein n=1 Tax=Paenibacillus sp. YIM B09110 TaxID=3126102 RepID=UPI00301E151A
MLEILIDNRNGNVWDITSIVPSLTYKTKRIGSASSLSLTLVKGSLFQSDVFAVNVGDVIRVMKDGIGVFYGYVFDIDSGKDESVSITAYDQIRYLLANDTYVFTNITASDIVKKIASDFKLQLGTISDTGYKIPKMSEDNKKLLDIICKALDLTVINERGNFFLYDDFGKLSLRNIKEMKLDFVVGDWSLMHDYGYKRSIDSDTYNYIKVYQDNKKTGKRDIHLGQDSANIAKWGRLQLYQQADEKMNEAQIKTFVDQLLTLKNREQKTLSIEALGDLRVRAGFYIPIVIQELAISQYFLVEDCTHKFDADAHTMSLELRVI